MLQAKQRVACGNEVSALVKSECEQERLESVFEQQQQTENCKWASEMVMDKVLRKRIWMCLILAKYSTRDARTALRTEYSSLPASSPARDCGAGAGIRN